MSLAKYARYPCPHSRGLRKLLDKPWLKGPGVVRTLFLRELIAKISAPRGTGILHVRGNVRHGQNTRTAFPYPAAAETNFREYDPSGESDPIPIDTSTLFRAHYRRRRVLLRTVRRPRFHAPAAPILIGHFIIEDEEICRSMGVDFEI
jgi:hypothetical protein